MRRFRWGGPLAVLTIAAAIGPAHSAQAGAAASAPEQSAATTCSVPLPTITTAYGDKIFRYQLPQGVISVPAPATSFDPATAPSDRLKALGLSSVPDTAPAAVRTRNLQELKGIRKGMATAPAAPCVHHDRRNTTAHVDTVHADDTSASTPNWAGYVANASSGSWSFASSTISFPSNFSPTACAPSTAEYAAWVGIGGFGNGVPLDQLGVDVTATALYKLIYQPFFELVNGTADTGGEVDIPNALPFKPGQQRYYGLNIGFFDDPTQPLTLKYLEETNPGTSKEVDNPFTFTPKTGDGGVYRQPTADYIAERPLLGIGQYAAYLRNTVQTTFTDAQEDATGASYDDRQFLGDSNPENLTMTSVDGKTALGKTGNLDTSGTGSFSSVWAACGQMEKPPA